ncbi:hypothetical protein Hanom_Chr17g01586971 [Helianthus anomalus]
MKPEPPPLSSASSNAPHRAPPWFLCRNHHLKQNNLPECSDLRIKKSTSEKRCQKIYPNPLPSDIECRPENHHCCHRSRNTQIGNPNQTESNPLLPCCPHRPRHRNHLQNTRTEEEWDLKE